MKYLRRSADAPLRENIMNTEIQTNEAGVAAQQSAARTAALAEIKRLQARIAGSGEKLSKPQRAAVFDSLETLTQHIGTKGAVECAFVAMVNDMRSQGELLKEIAGHAQISFQFFQYVKDELPFDFKVAHARVLLANKLPGPVESFDDAREVYRQVLEQAQLLPKEAGGEDRHLLATPIAVRFLNTMKLLKQDWQKTKRTSPIEEWPADQLRDYLSVTDWVDEDRNLAKALLAKAG